MSVRAEDLNWMAGTNTASGSSAVLPELAVTMVGTVPIKGQIFEPPTHIHMRDVVVTHQNNDSKTVDRNRAAISATFMSLVAKWRRETGHLSSPDDICTNPAYQAIIDMNKDAIPYILRDLEENKHYWFWALTAITEVNPIPKGFQGTYEEAIQIWLGYAKEAGYKW